MLPAITWDVDPRLLTMDGVSVRYYGALFVLTLLAGHALLLRQIRRGGGPVEEAGDFLAYALPGVMIGARLGHVLFYDFAKFLERPGWLFEIWKGGLASHGALAGVLLAMYWFTNRRAIAFLEGTDRLVYSAALATILIRLGNWMNSEVVGKPTDGTWGVRFPRYDGYSGDAPLRHPSQLYEVALGLGVFVALFVCDRALGRERRPRGALSGIFLVAYFGGRCIVEIFKEPEGIRRDALLNLGQLLSLPCLLAGALLLWQSLRERHAAGWVVGGAGSAEAAPGRQ
jgi:phosphatidylglycerol:prolipoprotein diacylglycerol transferase